MKKFKAPPPVADINVTPMVDVMLVMLIIFMVITPMLQTNVSVELVKTHFQKDMPDADKEDAIVVAVTKDGNIWLGSTKMQSGAADLPAKVKDLLSNRLNKMTYVKADARARYDKVVDVVDNLRASGVDQLGLMTDAVDDKNQAAPAQ